MAYKASTISKMIDQVCAQADKLKVRVDNLVNIILEHYATKGNGDTSLMSELVNKLSKRGVHRRAVIQKFERFGRVQLTVQDDKVKFVKKKGADHATIDLDKAKATPFYEDDSTDGRTAQDLKSFNLWGRMRSAIKREREIRQTVLANSKVNKIEDLTPTDYKRAGFDPDKTPLVPDDILDQMEAFIETYGNLDKPQPKSDRTVFKGAHPQTDDEPTLTAVAG